VVAIDGFVVSVARYVVDETVRVDVAEFGETIVVARWSTLDNGTWTNRFHGETRPRLDGECAAAVDAYGNLCHGKGHGTIPSIRYGRRYWRANEYTGGDAADCKLHNWYIKNPST
jgi:hypothetical protein